MTHDTFRRKGRWDSVGLDCSNCKYFKNPQSWPDKNQSIACNFHNISLTLELNKSGYKESEWFCREFKNDGKALEDAVMHFEQIKLSLKDKILYSFIKEGEELKEIDF